MGRIGDQLTYPGPCDGIAAAGLLFYYVVENRGRDSLLAKKKMRPNLLPPWTIIRSTIKRVGSLPLSVSRPRPPASVLSCKVLWHSARTINTATRCSLWCGPRHDVSDDADDFIAVEWFAQKRTGAFLGRLRSDRFPDITRHKHDRNLRAHHLDFV